MVDLARLSFDSSRDEGAFDLGDVVAELKNISRILSNSARSVSDEAKKGRSFPFLGAVGAGGLASRASSLLTGAAGGLTAGASLLALRGDEVSNQYERVRFGENGEDMIAEIDTKTGEIVRLLTLQEAQQQGIVDEYGRWRAGVIHNNTLLDQIGSNLSKVKDTYILDVDTVNNISAENKRQLQLLKDLNKAIADQIQSYGGEVSGKARSVFAGFTPNTPYAPSTVQAPAEKIVRDQFPLLDPSFFLRGVR